MYIINKISVVSFARLLALISLVITIIPWLIFGFFYLAFFRSYSYGYGGGIAIFSWLAFPLGAALVGFVCGLIIAGLYNLITRFTDGVKIDLILENQPAAPVTTPQPNNPNQQ